MKKKSQTDWERVDKMLDEDINILEIPPLDENFFKEATLRLPKDQCAITIGIDSDVLEWFKSQGKGYQAKINVALRRYMEACCRGRNG